MKWFMENVNLKWTPKNGEHKLSLLTDDQVRRLAESLIGTTSDPSDTAVRMFNLDESFDFHNDLTENQYSQFDEIAWMCEECGWWVDASGTEDGKCEDCLPRDED